MQIGNVIVNRMGANNSSLRLWWDVRIGRFWYVLIWRKGRGGPYCYRSTDATPPCKREDGYDNNGTWFFGKGRDD
jgi:hypothetical protein